MSVCRFVLSALATSILILNSSCSQQPAEGTSSPENHKLKIKYFYTVGGNRGYAPIEAGVEAALAEHYNDGDFALNKYVEVTGESDGDSPERAKELAREIRRDPYVLAVIGHPSSATTYAALPFYAEAGIPVIIPNASSPDVLKRHMSGSPPDTLTSTDDPHQHFTNAVRLIPGDVPDQAHAMALTIKSIWKIRYPDLEDRDEHHAKVLLVCDDTEETGAYVYSRPICEHLNTVERAEANFDVVDLTKLDKRSVRAVLPIIHATKPDFIVVAAYPLLARLVLQVWDEDRRNLWQTNITRGANQPGAAPIFIMPDACLSKEVRDLVSDLSTPIELGGGKTIPAPVSVYVTYPVAQVPGRGEGCTKRDEFLIQVNKQAQCQVSLHHLRCEEGDETKLKEAAEKEAKERGDNPKQQSSDFVIPVPIPETAETFAYDSVLVLENAVKWCARDNNLSRRCITDYLHDHHSELKGLCQTYHVEYGNRMNANYFVYEVSPNGMKWPTFGSASNDAYVLTTSTGK